MKKIKCIKLVTVVGVGALLATSATIFPVLAQKSQVKGLQNATKNLVLDLPQIPELALEEEEGQVENENIITMTQEEEKFFDDLVILMQKSTLLAPLESRELSDEESNRIITLRKKYIDGTIKLQKTLAIGENLEKPYYTLETEMYHYPETVMTDSELLQIIDFNYKRDMAFEKAYKVYVKQVMDKSDIKIPEEDAIKSAKNAIERIYGVELDNMEAKCAFSMGESEDENYWRIIFEPKSLDILREQNKLHWIYIANIDVYSGKVDYVDSYYSLQKDEREKSAERNLEDIIEHKKIAEEILTNKLNAKNIEFQKAYVRKSTQVVSFSKSLYLVYKAEDKYIEMEFLYGSKRMVSLFFFDDPEKLDERISKFQQESIGGINTSTNVEMYDSEGNEITMYEMSEEEYQKTDFRK